MCRGKDMISVPLPFLRHRSKYSYVDSISACVVCAVCVACVVCVSVRGVARHAVLCKTSLGRRQLEQTVFSAPKDSTVEHGV